MAYRLKVNFFKSCLIRVNVAMDFMEMACEFLNCNKGDLPFKYLGFQIGLNSGRCATWQTLLDLLICRLNNWGNKFIILGGRIVLLNSMLNSILKFYLSYMKMPLTVWKKIVKIQREFLWGGVRKLNWVRWSLV